MKYLSVVLGQCIKTMLLEINGMGAGYLFTKWSSNKKYGMNITKDQTFLEPVHHFNFILII